jgi:hypothetical protein
MVHMEANDAILKKYTVDELDMLHDLVGLGAEWSQSARRAKLVKIESMELALIKDIIEDIHIIPKEQRGGNNKNGPDANDRRVPTRRSRLVPPSSVHW